MRIAFHSNQLGIRGTEVSLFDYAWYNRELLDNESYIVSDHNADLSTLTRFEEHFPVFLYNEFAELEGFVAENDIEAVYFQKAGSNDGKLVGNAKNLVHAVFQIYEPHGEVYAYISEWLSQKMSKGQSPFVPYIVSLPEVDRDNREKLEIPAEATVFGRHGGLDQFDLPFVHEVVYSIAKSRPDYFFLLMNTRPFCQPLPNIIHLDPSYDPIEKTAFINTCDAMLHGRSDGESFGLAIAEFLHQDKPVIAGRFGIDFNHLTMLGEHGRYYRTAHELYELLINFEKESADGRYRELVKCYQPAAVMEKFRAVYLSGG